MSELMNARSSNLNLRWRLLTTVSALGLLATVCEPSKSAVADQDAERPTVWIELGGQMDHMNGEGDVFVPGFLAANSASPVLQSTTPLQAQNPPPFTFGEEGKIAFEPEGSAWVFTAAVRYGRSSNNRNVDHQTNRFLASQPPVISAQSAEDFADTQVYRRESHAILDFSIGKDVGLGFFGENGSSILSLGVRFAQFAAKSTFDVRARPDLHINYLTLSTLKVPFKYFHTYHATGGASRSFRGLGPSLSWNGSMPFAGSPQDGEITLDWGVNAAVLFGKQRTRVQHQESAHYKDGGFGVSYATFYQHPPAGHSDTRSVIVPNLGGYAGISVRYTDVKLSLGYRSDFFFGAIDGGVDTRKSETLGFFGPFAALSIGLGG